MTRMAQVEGKKENRYFNGLVCIGLSLSIVHSACVLDMHCMEKVRRGLNFSHPHSLRFLHRHH